MSLDRGKVLWTRSSGIVRLSIVAAAAAAWLVCTRDYNPFADPANARVKVIARTFKTVEEGDSVCIFSSETLSVVAAARELLDSFSISIPNNRFDSLYVWRPGEEHWQDARFDVTFSLVSSGTVPITITSYPASGEKIPYALTVRAYSPLRQSPLSGVVGERLRLATDSVRDRDVLYHWDFGGREIASPTPVLDTTLRALSTFRGKGRLWVSDVRNEKRSPDVLFDYLFSDTSGPMIRLFAGQGDTAVATGETYRLELLIEDVGTGLVVDPQVNGKALERTVGGTYVAVISGLAGLEIDQALELEVKAWDGLGNLSRRYFWLIRKPSPQTRSLLLSILSPTGEDVWSTEHVFVVGTAESYDGQAFSAQMSLSINGVPWPETLHVSGAPKAMWQWAVNVDLAVNVMEICGRDLRSGSIECTTVTVRYDPAAPDTQAPQIALVSVDGAIVDSGVHYTTKDSVTLRVIAFDQGSGIKAIFVNGRKLEPEADSTPFAWRCKLQAVHGGIQPSDTVVATDNAGHALSVGVRICRNRLPLLIGGLDNPCRVGRELRDTIEVEDYDGDAVKVSLEEAPPGMIILDRVVVWTPPASAQGMVRVGLRLDDGYQTTLEVRQLAVGPAENAPCSLSVQPRHGQIVSAILTLSAAQGPDTLDYVIHDEDVGQGERYAVWIISGAMTVNRIIEASRTFEVVVDPAKMVADRQPLRVIVEDAGGHRDTVDIMVVRAQTQLVEYRRRCRLNLDSLSVRPMFDITNIPLVVRLNAENFDFSVTTRGGGVRFEKRNGNPIPYDIERWEPDSQRAEIWVRLDTVYANRQDQYFVLIWDPTLPGLMSQPESVFTVSHSNTGVWHLDDGQSGAEGRAVFEDATAFGNDGQDFAVAPRVAGAVGYGQQFNGISDYVSVPDAPSLQAQSYTIMLWFYVSSILTDATLLSKPLGGWGWSYRLWSDRSSRIVVSHQEAEGFRIDVQSQMSVPAFVWTHLAVTFSRETVRLYINGNIVSSGQYENLSYDDQPLIFGAGDVKPGPRFTPFGGVLDEIRISNTARSASWIRMSYENQRPGSKFITVGP